MSNSKKVVSRDAFRKANKARKRVLIAKDVLLQLDLKRFKPTPGHWVKGIKWSIDPDAQVCELVNGKKCEVCGIGSLFVSAVEFANKLDVDEAKKTSESGYLDDKIVCFNYLHRWFSESQLEAIETAFEMGEGATYSADGMNFWNNIYEDDLGGIYENPELRMRLIMENIIRNKGFFNTEDRPVVKSRTFGFE